MRATPLLERIWYQGHPLQWLLWPFSLLFGLLSGMRRVAYRLGLLRSHRLSVPVVIVGNISVGGTGKTPFTVWLIEELRRRGWQPGIISRGYGGHGGDYPLAVTSQSDPGQSGDEPRLLAQRCGCPVMVDPQRVRAAATLLEEHAVDIIVSDDGLQHYALARDLEFVITDAARGLGNGLLLPAGPLRESAARLDSVAAVLVNGAGQDETGFSLLPANVLHAVADERCQSLAAFLQQPVHAVAGIGYPERFFSMLESAGFTVIRHPLPDHHDFQAVDICFDDALPVLMTEKDAVKCQALADERHWYLPVSAQPNAAGQAVIDAALALLQRTRNG